MKSSRADLVVCDAQPFLWVARSFLGSSLLRFVGRFTIHWIVTPYGATVGKTKLLANMLSEIEADAYRHGFNDGVRAALKAVKGLRPSDPNQRVTGANGAEPVDPFDPTEPRAQSQPTRQLRENSDQMRVLKAIRTTPGMRG